MVHIAVMSAVVDAVEGTLIGGLAATVILYSFQTKVAYPDPVLQVIDHPWVVLLAFLGVLLIATKGHHEVTALLLLLLVAFVMDTTLFARRLPPPATQTTQATPTPTLATPDTSSNVIQAQPTSTPIHNPKPEHNPISAVLEVMQFPVFHEIQDGFMDFPKF